jgi:hypothetical protein
MSAESGRESFLYMTLITFMDEANPQSLQAKLLEETLTGKSSQVRATGILSGLMGAVSRRKCFI